MTAPNNLAVFPNVPNTGARGVVLATGNITKDGTAGVTLVYTAGTAGGRVKFLELHAIGSNIASLLRVFLNNGLTNGTAGNNSFIAEAPLPITTLIETAMTGPPIIVPLFRELGPSERIYVVLATTVAAGWAVTAWGEDF